MKKIKAVAIIFIFASLLGAPQYAWPEEDVGAIKRTWRAFLSRLRGDDDERVIKRKSMKAPTHKVVSPPRPVVLKDKEKGGKKSPISEMEVEKLLEIMEYNIEAFGDELLSFVPQIKKKVDEKGAIHYVYSDEETPETELKDLPRKKLESLYYRVLNESTRLQQERLMRQLESIRQATNIQKTPTPPTPYIPPAPPPQPPQVPKTPEVPKPPPEPPRR